MVIELKAVDFKISSWEYGVDCILATTTKKALQRMGFKAHVEEKIDHIRISYFAESGCWTTIKCKHERYSFRKYSWDRMRAYFLSYSSLVIRRITIQNFPPQILSTKTPLEVVEELEGRSEVWP
jgi:hypothetical protein